MSVLCHSAVAGQSFGYSVEKSGRTLLQNCAYSRGKGTRRRLSSAISLPCAVARLALSFVQQALYTVEPIPCRT